MPLVALSFLKSPRFCGQSGEICPFAPQVQQLQTLKLSLARVWARLKVLLVGVHLVDLASVRLVPWGEALVGPVLCPDLYDLAFDLDHHDLFYFFLFLGSLDSPIIVGKSLLSQQRGVHLIVPLSVFIFFWMDA
ncbi:UNVERIFIED_CONTAM: hypothetical protein Sradi_0475800 [Sesamum radiatum]|uniref:Uncharacterized protein n=1 Tax=Sesamum radiatum TaxID=300843 RepID=A0AAW2W790_SESRA